MYEAFSKYNPSDPFYMPDEDIIYFNEHYENDEFWIIFHELNLNYQQQYFNKTRKSAGPDKLINESFIYEKGIFKCNSL